MMGIDVSIVIVNWNAGLQLKACIDSIVRFGEGYVKEIIVVDNGSVDGSQDFVAKVPNTTLLLLGENLGFGKACNLGAAHANSDYLFFLNPDAAIFAGTLAKVIHFMEDPVNHSVGICGVKLIDDNGKVSRCCARFPSAKKMLMHSIGVDRVFPRLGYNMHEWNHHAGRKVDHVIGAFFFVRRQVFSKLGGFDERFFVYLEDLDFSFRAFQAGWSSFYLANAKAAHAGGGTSNRVRSKRLFYSLRSRLLYSFKHFSFPAALVVLMATLFIEPCVRSMFAFYRMGLSSVKEIWIGYFMLYRWLPKWIIKNETR